MTQKSKKQTAAILHANADWFAQYGVNIVGKKVLDENGEVVGHIESETIEEGQKVVAVRLEKGFDLLAFSPSISVGWSGKKENG